MAKKKAAKPPIVNGLQDDFIVSKSRPLVLMKEVPFALGELKVLDTYLSRINPKDPAMRTVRFSKEEYEDLMGIERMRPERLSKYVDSLMGKVVTVPDRRVKGGWRKYTLFSTCECGQDENEQWWIDLSCTTEARKLFFNLEGIGYIRYQLKNVLPLTSKYSVLLYIYLLDNRFRRSWTVPLDEIREKILRCDSETYQDFKYFKRDILDKALKEVNAKTDLTFEYESVKVGRKVSALKFILIKDEVTLPLEEDPAQMRLEDFEDLDDFEDVDDLYDPTRKNQLYAEELPDHFTPEQVEMIRSLAMTHVDYGPSMELHAADYIRSKVRLMKVQKKPVAQANQFSWLCKAVEQDWSP